MRFSVRQITDRSLTGFYSLTLFTFSFALLNAIGALVENWIANDKWTDGVGNYISTILLVVFIANTILAFHRRKDDAIPWMTPHLRRAWHMCLLTWVLIVILLIGVLVYGIANDFPDFSTFEENIEAFSIYLNAVIYIPWSIIALLKLKDDRDRQKAS